MNAHGVVAAVAPGSLAAEAGIRAGDEIVSINGHPLRDVIDYQFYSADEQLEIVTQHGTKTLTYHFVRGYGDNVGIEFTAPTFDGMRRCHCRCVFCFVQQMPPGMRSSLYVKDDDYRYSFLFGNFVTLTNLTDEDWARLEEQRLSPLYISVHATEPELRRRILGHPGAPDIVAQLRGLGHLGIEVHAQIVLTPGLNDGAALTRTISDLAALRQTVRSIAIVPVGLTRFQRRGLRSLTPAEAAELVQRMSVHHNRFRRERGTGLVYLSDEIYLLAGQPVPPAEAYDGFPQLENGVGLTRQLLDEWDALRDETAAIRPAYRRATVVCGALIAPILEQILTELGAITGVELRLVSVPNRFFGPSVTVSGLLTAADVIAALRRRDPGELVVLPRVMFDAAGERTLDERTPEEMARELGVRVAVAGTLKELLYA